MNFTRAQLQWPDLSRRFSAALPCVLSSRVCCRRCFCSALKATRPLHAKDLAIACSPFVLLDWLVVGFLLGLMHWYADKSDRCGGVLVSRGGGCLSCLPLPISIAVWMWQDMSRSGSLGCRGTAESCRYKHRRPITNARRGVRGRIEYTHYVKEALHFWGRFGHLCSNKVL